MSKHSVYTTITPLPAGINRHTFIETLHTHTEMIDLNPLVEERHPIKAPPHATPEEFHCQWYELTDKIQYLPGGIYSGRVTYTACFHDLANGVQTHIFAPMGLEIRGKWTIDGSLPGEPQAPVEMGKGIPLTGLYLREDTDLKCSIFLTKFVKKNLKTSHAALVARMLVKAQLQEAAMNNDSMSEASHQSHGSNSPHVSYTHPNSIGSHYRSPLASSSVPSPGYINSSIVLNNSQGSHGLYGYAPVGHSASPAPLFSPLHGYSEPNPGQRIDAAYSTQNEYLQPHMIPHRTQAPHPALQSQSYQAIQGYDLRLSSGPSELAGHDVYTFGSEDVQQGNPPHNSSPPSSTKQEDTGSNKAEKKEGTSLSAGPPVYHLPAAELPAELPN